MDQKQKVTVFSTPTCPWCTKVKQYLKENEVEFEEINVAADMEKAKEMVKKSGSSGVPQLWIGEEVVVGFNQARIDELLEL
jgi:glutaredoxin-like YruB-family protein